jgi:hypothetical protein
MDPTRSLCAGQSPQIKGKIAVTTMFIPGESTPKPIKRLGLGARPKGRLRERYTFTLSKLCVENLEQLCRVNSCTRSAAIERLIGCNYAELFTLFEAKETFAQIVIKTTLPPVTVRMAFAEYNKAFNTTGDHDSADAFEIRIRTALKKIAVQEKRIESRERIEQRKLDAEERLAKQKREAEERCAQRAAEREETRARQERMAKLSEPRVMNRTSTG